MLDPIIAETLAKLDVITMGDLTTPGSGGNRDWITKKKLKEAGLGALTPILAGIQPPSGNPCIRVGYCMVHKDTVGKDILEVLGWIGEKVCVRRCTPCSKKAKMYPWDEICITCGQQVKRGWQ